jgi:hypothetical protein
MMIRISINRKERKYREEMGREDGRGSAEKPNEITQ